MEKKTIGAFLAILRKANGMTQQQVADRLNVSNKTISKWECDESMPDIMLIPALAEMFHVTSDEILRGQRLEQGTELPQRTVEKTEAQAKSLIGHTLNKHLSWIIGAMAVLAVGMILLLTISYAFYRPVLGFGLFMILMVAAAAVIFISLNAAKTALTGGEVMSEEGIKSAELRLHARTKIALISIAVLLIWALPLIIFRNSRFVESVISWRSYLLISPILIVLSTGVAWLISRILRGVWHLPKKEKTVRERLVRLYALCGGAAVVVLCAALSAQHIADTSRQNSEQVVAWNIQVNFADAAAMDEFMQASYACETGNKELWQNYIADAMKEYGIPWKNASLSDVDMQTLQGIISEAEAAASETQVLAEYLPWTMLPIELNVQRQMAVFQMWEMKMRGPVLSWLAITGAGWLLLGAAVWLCRRRILSKQQQIEEIINETVVEENHRKASGAQDEGAESCLSGDADRRTSPDGY